MSISLCHIDCGTCFRSNIEYLSRIPSPVVILMVLVVLEVVLVVLEVVLDPSGKVSWKGIRYSSYF